MLFKDPECTIKLNLFEHQSFNKFLTKSPSFRLKTIFRVKIDIQKRISPKRII